MSRKKKTTTNRRQRALRPGVRRYGFKTAYSEDTLKDALLTIQSGKMSIWKAASHFQIPRSTLDNKLHGRHSGEVGRRPVFDRAEEEAIVNHLLYLSEIGLPLAEFDVRYIVQGYLNDQNRQVPQFKENLPGPDWIKGLVARHSDRLSKKLVHNIPQKRARVGEEDIIRFFDHYEEEALGVPKENLWNIDESGFHDTPSKHKYLVRRKARNPEQIKNCSKACYTTVFCGSATGILLPPYVIMKGKEKWTDWLTGGPKDAMLNCSKSGWIEQHIFEDWFERLFVPSVLAHSLAGKKLLLLDNMSAHISIKCLKLAVEHNIHFVFLVPNATHLLQPLDVGYFSSLKHFWRDVLTEWRRTKLGRRTAVLPKSLFAQLLCKALDKQDRTKTNCLLSGFRATGLAPINRFHVIEKLPKYARNEVDISEKVGEQFKKFIDTSLHEEVIPLKKSRKFCLPVDPGRSVSLQEVENYYQERITAEENKRGRGRGSGRARGERGARGGTTVGTTTRGGASVNVGTRGGAGVVVKTRGGTRRGIRTRGASNTASSISTMSNAEEVSVNDLLTTLENGNVSLSPVVPLMKDNSDPSMSVIIDNLYEDFDCDDYLKELEAETRS